MAQIFRRTSWIVLEVVDTPLPVGRLAIEVFVDLPLAVKLLAQERQQGGELGKDQHLVTLVLNLVQHRQEGLEFS